MNDNEPVSLLFERKRAVMRRTRERLRLLREDYEARYPGQPPGAADGISARLAAALNDVKNGRVETHTVEEFLAHLRRLGD